MLRVNADTPNLILARSVRVYFKYYQISDSPHSAFMRFRLTFQFVVSAAILLSMVAGLFTPSTQGQIYTTITQQTTSTSPMIYTVTHSTPFYSYTTTMEAQATILNQAVTYSGVGGCNWNSYDFVAVSGQTVFGSVSANLGNTLAVFILSDHDYYAWNAPGNNYCDPSYSNNVAVQWSEGSYDSPLTRVDVRWIAPYEGKFWFIIETRSSARVVVTANVLSQYEREKNAVVYYSSTLTGTAYVAKTLTTSTVETLPTFYIIIEGSVGLVLVMFLTFFVISRTKGSRKSKGKISDQAVALTDELTRVYGLEDTYDVDAEMTPVWHQLCHNCGAELRLASNYCDNCGEPVTPGNTTKLRATGHREAKKPQRHDEALKEK
ncbi:MAG TPA: zinc ribbon domain-containing protein [Terriglobales bacterium]|nr:zinc ribbon domain-containing protein [Terriglobales bacterium]